MRKIASSTLALLLLLAGAAFAGDRGDRPPSDRPGDRGDAFRVVSRVLELTEEQVAAWQEITAGNAEETRALHQQVRTKEGELRELLADAAADPAAIGTLMLEIRSLQEQIRGLAEAATADFLALLTPEQLEKIDEIRAAAQLCPAVPAFHALGLLRPPDEG